MRVVPWSALGASQDRSGAVTKKWVPPWPPLPCLVRLIRDPFDPRPRSHVTLVDDGGLARLAQDGLYDRRRRTVTIDESLLAEDPRVVAVVLAHELRHAVDLAWMAQGLDLDCLGVEAQGFQAEAVLARAFWPDVLPDRTNRERDLAGIVATCERGGFGGLRDQLVRDGVYGEPCADWRA